MHAPDCVLWSLYKEHSTLLSLTYHPDTQAHAYCTFIWRNLPWIQTVFCLASSAQWSFRVQSLPYLSFPPCFLNVLYFFKKILSVLSETQIPCRIFLETTNVSTSQWSRRKVNPTHWSPKAQFSVQVHSGLSRQFMEILSWSLMSQPVGYSPPTTPRQNIVGCSYEQVPIVLKRRTCPLILGFTPLPYWFLLLKLRPP